jgi:isopenicillin N synthase-like dioxygenase
MLNIPIIDISSLPDDSLAIGEIAGASEHFGCFHIVNHGIPDVLTSNFFAQMHLFFDLPEEKKLQISRTADNPWGYFDRELTKNTRDWKEIFDYGIDQEEGDAGSVSQWPNQPAEFRPVMMAWFNACEEVASRVLAALCLALDMPADTLASDFAPHHSSFVRLNYYPPCDVPADENSPTDVSSGSLGINHHTDAGALTLLAHDEVPALQVEHESGWHTVAPNPDGLFVNIGDMMQVWSNDRFKAALHRVLANEKQRRYSAPFFYNPSFTAVCRPLDATTLERPARYRTIPWKEYRQRRAQGDYADYGDEVQISMYRTDTPES